ncbi:MAG: toxin-antitoxin system YwqK family antitoxin [Aquaticitalea sp.]
MKKTHTFKSSIAPLIGVLIFIGLISCKKEVQEVSTNHEFDYSIDTSQIPKDTIYFDDDNVSFNNGLYYLKGELYSGVVYKEQKGFQVKTYSSVLNGKLYGTYRSYYSNGKPYEIRSYKNNLSVGKQRGYWEDTGILKFEYNYYNEKREGLQKSWFSDGTPAYVYNYKDDKQDGLQQAWRINGSLYRNFEAKNGKRYGLQKAVSCKELIAEKIRQ